MCAHCIWVLSILNGASWNIKVVLTCIYIMIKYIEHFSQSFVFHLWGLCLVPCPVLFCFLGVQIFVLSPHSRYELFVRFITYRIFSYEETSLFTWKWCPLMYRRFCFMRFLVFFFVVCFFVFVSGLNGCITGVLFRKFFLSKQVQAYALFFCFIRSKVSGPLLKSYILWSWVLCKTEEPVFNSLHKVIQIDQHHLLKILSFLRCI